MSAGFGLQAVSTPLRPFIAHRGSFVYYEFERVIKKRKKNKAYVKLRGLTGLLFSPLPELDRAYVQDFEYAPPRGARMEVSVPCFKVLISEMSGEGDNVHVHPSCILYLYEEGEQEIQDVHTGKEWEYGEDEVRTMDAFAHSVLCAIYETMQEGGGHAN